MAVISQKVNDDKRVELTISVGAEEFGKAIDAAYRKNVKRMQVPGFRKGKAPRKMIEKMYGEGVFFEDAINSTYPKAYQAAIIETGIKPVDRADIEVEDASAAEGYTFKATVAVKPEVKVADYKGLKVEKVVRTATDEDVDAEIKRMQEKAAAQSMIGDMGRYTQIAAADSMGKGGHGAGMASDMVGLQMGMAIGQQMVNQMNLSGAGMASQQNMQAGAGTVPQQNMQAGAGTMPQHMQTEAAASQQGAQGGAGPKFCPNCGTPATGTRFCGNCGNKLF